MKHRIHIILKCIGLLIFCLLASNACAVDKFPTRILFLGNSYFYYNNSLHNHVKGFVEAGLGGQGKDLQYKSATIGGASLDHHPIEWLTEPGRIGVQKPFEWVVLAGNSADALSERGHQLFAQTVRRFHRVIASRGAKTALYMTHAYVSPHRQASSANIDKIADMYSGVAKELNATIIPVGLAFEESYKRRPDLLLHDSHDGSHPSLLGTYLAAAVTYTTLYGADPVGNGYSYRGKISAKDALFLQQVARDIALNR